MSHCNKLALRLAEVPNLWKFNDPLQECLDRMFGAVVVECGVLHARCDEAERAAQEWAEYAQNNNEALQAMRAELESLRIEVQSLRAEMSAKLH